ncbi:CPBP family intramembrane metalloprotease [Salipiger sp. IMCC34102]|uniref:CPBP family intramembrane glutamic endopeptidase n=1 Tax=Salipiger sp. IMCC34102 TaxID=2510647 RepID=UPI00101D30E0|nr:CPBP family intramembrane glutamic endopeptidase [Salipiger sp. IMCC34102]RYH03201.1 CPBP family intramembrane metalloprotease [Salipiger sp. IMCC34102]
MTQIRTFATARPLWAAVIAVLVVLALLFSPVLISGPTDLTQGTGTLEVVVGLFALVFQSAAAALALAAVWVLGWGRETTLIARSDPEGLKLSAWFLGPVVILCLACAVLALQAPRYDATGARLVMTLLFGLAVGVTEEVLFRGVLMHGLRSRVSTGRALVICSLAFAVSHSANGLWGQSPLLTAQQIGFTFVFGALLGAIALQTASLWPAILLHGLWDVAVITLQLVEDPFVPEPGSDPTGPVPQGGPPPDATTYDAPPLETWAVIGTAGVALGVIAVVGLLALIVYRRWRRRIAASAVWRA